MDDRSHIEPIEIELTSDEWAHESMQPDVEPAGAGLPARSVSEMRRLVTVALVTGLLGVALGWGLGRAGSDSAAPEEPVASASASVPQTMVEELSGDPIPAVQEPAPTTPANPTTTTPPDRLVDLVDVHPSLTGRPIELVGIDTAGHLVVLDLATGSLVTDTGQRFSRDSLGPLAAGPDWVALIRFDREELTVIRDGVQPEATDAGEVWGLIRVPATDRFWRLSGPGSIAAYGSRIYEEFSLGDGPTGRRVELTGAVPILADPAGGLVASSAGKAYVFGDGGGTLLGAGDVLAVGRDVAVFRECDETMRCYLAALDRATGASTELPVDREIVAGIDPYFWGLPASMASTMSPNGEFAMLRLVIDDAPQVAVVDVRSGVTNVLAEAEFPFPALAWSDDGRFAFYTDRQVPMVWDSETGTSAIVAADVDDWGMLAVRAGRPTAG